MDQQDRDRGRCDPRNARRLPERRRPGLAELLAHFVREPAEQRVVEIRRQRRLLVAPRPLDLILLPLDVPRVAGAYLDLHADLCREAIVDRRGDAAAVVVVAAAVTAGAGAGVARLPTRRSCDLEQRGIAHAGPAQQLEGGRVAPERSAEVALRPRAVQVAGPHAQPLEPRQFARAELLLRHEQPPALLVHESELSDRKSTRLNSS